jgi:hypothetical protein
MVGAPERVEPDCSGMFVEAAYAMAKIYQPAEILQQENFRNSSSPRKLAFCLSFLPSRIKGSREGERTVSIGKKE